MRTLKVIKRHSICWSMVVVFVLMCAMPAASSEEHECYLEASYEDILVAVWNADADDNTKNEFWRGRIPDGEQQSIQCETGRIKISTKSTEPDTALVNKGYHDCTGGNVIQLSSD